MLIRQKMCIRDSYDAIYILFHTGLRISEFCGLTVSEIEFGEMRIKVDHQLQRTAQMQYVIEEPKTDKGIRYVPMTEAVAACFRRIIANRKTPKVEPMLEGYAGFLFLDKNDIDVYKSQVLVREFCEQQFVSKGMIADFAIHVLCWYGSHG